jgi:hypothetical protein
MKMKKKLIALVASLAILGTAGTVYANELKSPAEILSGLTGKTVNGITTERATGKTYGTIADEAGKLEEYKSEILQQKKAILDQRVKDGNLTQQQADALFKAMETNQATCDITGGNRMGRMNGAGLGCGAMMGQGRGAGMGGGFGRGAGMGYGYGQGSGSLR